MEPSVLRRRLAALLVGMALAACVVAASFFVLPAQDVTSANVEYGYVYSGAKSSSTRFVRANLTEDSIVMLGSSEFSTPASSVPQIPAQVFGTHNYGIRCMLVGEAFDQCLWHAIAMGALAQEGLPRDKVVFTVGLGQFTDGGMDSSTFSTRFSYSLFREFCDNQRIPTNVRDYVLRRLREQGVDDTTVRAGSRQDVVSSVDDAVLGSVDDLRLREQLIAVRKKGKDLVGVPADKPDWDALRAKALEDAQRMSTTNDWGAEDGFYTSQLGPALEGLKGVRAGETYTDTPEYDDLDCFLSVCDACGIEPLVVISPSMGPYYDYIGIDRQTRERAYQRIREVIAKHERARLADFSDREYEKYFLFDIVHFGWTGWIDVERAIYEFAMEEA